ncbi:MAG: dephospho-CoA kinase, partial [Acidobacteriota bacterium]
AGHSALVREYGAQILLPDQQIDRAAVAAIAFADRDSVKRLNALIHPLVFEEEERVLSAELARFPGRDRIFVVEATLLLEAGGRQRYDRVVVVDVKPEQQIERAVSRGMGREEAKRRIALQMERSERLRYADYVIDNSGDLRTGEIETHRVFARLQKDLQAMTRGDFIPWSGLED